MLKFYLISTVISSIVTIICVLAIEKELIREGYKDKTKYSLVEYMRVAIILAIPIYNIIISCIALFYSDEFKEYRKAKYLKI